MAEWYAAKKLSELKREIHENSGYWGADDLEDAVLAALGVEGPPGKPDWIAAAANALSKSSIEVDGALTEVKRLRSHALPDAWSGEAHVAAMTALKAFERELERVIEAFRDAQKALAEHGHNLVEDQQKDKRGMGPLESARDRLRGHTGWFNYDAEAVNVAHSLAISGIDDRHKAADHILDSAERTVIQLKDLTGAARLAKLSGSRLDPVSELVISDAGGRGDADELILTPLGAQRAQEAINRLNPADRQRLDALLAQAKSPEEQAYILKALAAGYSMDKVAAFDGQIHAHGDDPAWLKDRLSPMDTSDSSNDVPRAHTQTTSHGQSWTQQDPVICSPASSVMARAQVDPLYALQLTTGGHPGDPAFDNPAAFNQRLHDEQRGLYDDERKKFDDEAGEPGFLPSESEALAGVSPFS